MSTTESLKNSGFTASLRHFSQDIKLSHSVFALPFAASSIPLANIALPNWSQTLLLLVAMVTARSFAMGMNRFLDRHIDAANPRTVNRKIPAGELHAMHSLGWSLVAGVLFIAAAYALSQLAGLLALPLLIVLATYSLIKRLSWLVHFYLGFCLGLAPMAVEIALTGSASLAVLLLGISVTLWTAGFDILYSLQDSQFDQSQGLYSIPAKFGARKALWFSRLSFVAMILLLLAVGQLAVMGPIYFLGVSILAIILAYEQWLVRDASHSGTSQNINAAFFNVNAWVSVVFFFFALADRIIL